MTSCHFFLPWVICYLSCGIHFFAYSYITFISSILQTGFQCIFSLTFSRPFLVTWLEARTYADIVRDGRTSQGSFVRLVRTSAAESLSRYHKNAIVTLGSNSPTPSLLMISYAASSAAMGFFANEFFRTSAKVIQVSGLTIDMVIFIVVCWYVPCGSACVI